MKTCIMCGALKPLEDYYKHRAMADGRLGRCKACHRSEMRKVRANNIERYREYDRTRGKTDGRKKMYNLKNKKKIASAGPQYMASHYAVSRAVKSGKLIRPDHCSKCLVQCFPQAHHDDYNKPLDVMWLCPICHAHRHRELGKLITVDAPLVAPF